jgi:hypothetical protein
MNITRAVSSSIAAAGLLFRAATVLAPPIALSVMDTTLPTSAAQAQSCGVNCSQYNEELIDYYEEYVGDCVGAWGEYLFYNQCGDYYTEWVDLGYYCFD